MSDVLEGQGVALIDFYIQKISVWQRLVSLSPVEKMHDSAGRAILVIKNRFSACCGNEGLTGLTFSLWSPWMQMWYEVPALLDFGVTIVLMRSAGILFLSSIRGLKAELQSSCHFGNVKP